MLCKYGCGQEALFIQKDGMGCCSDKWCKCPVKRKKRSEDQIGAKNHAFGKKPWNKGLTEENDSRVKKYTDGSKEAKRKGFANGSIVVWNKGLDKSDPRVAKYAEAQSISRKGVPNLKLRVPVSQSRSKTVGKFRALFKTTLYISWILPIMKRDGFKCNLCGKSKCRLEVHHLSPNTYRNIFETSCIELNLDIKKWKEWTQEQINNLQETIEKKHKLEQGITVCVECHSKIDPSRKNGKNKIHGRYI
jgi:hypothetical protein